MYDLIYCGDSGAGKMRERSYVTKASIITTAFVFMSAFYLVSPFIPQNAQAKVSTVVSEPYIFIPDGEGAELLIDDSDNLYILHIVMGDIFFRKYNSFHFLEISDKALYLDSSNRHLDAVMDDFGYIHFTWTTQTTDNREDSSVMYAKINKSGDFVVQPMKLSGTKTGHSSAIDVNSLGQAYVAWDYWWDVGLWYAEDVLYAMIDSDGSIIFTEQYVAPEGWHTAFYGKKDIIVDRDDNLHVLFGYEPAYEPMHLYYKKYGSDGTTVLVSEKQLTFSGYYYWSSTLEATLDSQGRINIAYSYGVPGKRLEVFYLRIDLLGNVEIGPIELSQEDFYHSRQAYLAMDGYGNSYVFWSESATGNDDIYYSALDMDGNIMTNRASVTSNDSAQTALYMAAVFDSYDFCIWSHYDDNGTYVVYHFAPPPPALTTEVANDDDILLRWTPYDPSFTDHYLIYRSTDQREFDFTTAVYDTSYDIDRLRTNWTDADAAGSNAPREYYYVVRAVSPFGMMSNTSNTAGKWTEGLSKGRDAFSLPLEPFVNRNVSWYSENIPGTEFVRWMNATGHWVTHYPSMGESINDIPAVMGDSYEISLSSQINFTFCGYPASMIRFQDGLGDSTEFRKSLSAQKDGSNIVLIWNSLPGANEYKILKSIRRNGFHQFYVQAIVTVPPVQNTWTDYDALSNEGELYYMIVPVDFHGSWSSSTYSVGVSTLDYQSGSDTFALPFKPVEPHSLDWYCDNIPNAVGIIHLMKGYWRLHAREMPEGVYDADSCQGEGYQISFDGGTTSYTFIGH